MFEKNKTIFFKLTHFRVALLMKNGANPNIIPNDKYQQTTYVLYYTTFVLPVCLQLCFFCGK